MDQDQERRVAQLPWAGRLRAFSVSPSKALAEGYIARQKEHHRKRSFQEERIQFLRKYGVEYDERFLACDPFRVVMRCRVGPHFPGALPRALPGRCPRAALPAPFQGAQCRGPEMKGTCSFTLSRNTGRATALIQKWPISSVPPSGTGTPSRTPTSPVDEN
jgi:hypothetical protein